MFLTSRMALYGDSPGPVPPLLGTPCRIRAVIPTFRIPLISLFHGSWHRGEGCFAYRLPKMAGCLHDSLQVESDHQATSPFSHAYRERSCFTGGSGFIDAILNVIAQPRIRIWVSNILIYYPNISSTIVGRENITGESFILNANPV